MLQHNSHRSLALSHSVHDPTGNFEVCKNNLIHDDCYFVLLYQIFTPPKCLHCSSASSLSSSLSEPSSFDKLLLEELSISSWGLTQLTSCSLSQFAIMNASHSFS